MKNVKPAEINWFIDLCIFHEGKRTNLLTDSKFRAVKWSKLIAQSRFDRLRLWAQDIFTVLCHSKNVCPEVWFDDFDEQLTILWEDGPRWLYVRISPSGPVEYCMARSYDQSLINWLPITNEATTEEVLFKLGRYLTGQKETDCGGEKRKAG